MVSACPSESDPRLKIEEFIKGDGNALAGLRTEGIDVLAKLIKKELKKQFPEGKVVLVDHDKLAENNVCFPQDMRRMVLDSLSANGRTDFVIVGEPPVIGWNKAFDNLPLDVGVYHITLGCRQVPVCTRRA